MPVATGYIPRAYRQIPHVAPAHIPSAGRPRGGGRAGNPLEQSYEGGEGDVDEPYLAPSGGIVSQLIAQQFNKDVAGRNEAKHHAAAAAQQDKIQAGVDAYQQALEKTGDPRQALASVFHSDTEGHVHFADPATFNAILNMHEAASASGTGQFGIVDLGHGLFGIQDPNGKYSVHNAHNVTSSHLTTGYRLDENGRQIPTVINKDTATSTDVTDASGGNPIRKDAPAQKQLSTTKAQTDQLQDIQTVLDNVQKMRNAVGASGSLGYGSIERGLALHTGLGGKQAEAYNAAYNDMAPALVRLARVPGQSKMVAELALDKLPKPGQAQAFNVDQALPNIEYQMRQQVGNLYQTYKLENRPGGREMAKAIAQTYDAHPDQMKELEQAKLALRQNPGQMPNELIDPLMHEAQQGRLPYDDWTRVMRQGVQRGLIDPKNFDKLAAASPDLAQISPEEHAAPQFIRPWQQGSMPARAPTTPQQGAPGAPGQIPPGAQQGAPATPQMAASPLVAPTTGQQQAQQPEQVQQQATDQSSQNPGFLGQLIQHLPTAIQGLLGNRTGQLQGGGLPQIPEAPLPQLPDFTSGQ